MAFVKTNIYFHCFNLIEGFTSSCFKKISNYFPSIETAWKADIYEFKKAKLSDSLIEKIKNKRKEINPELELEKLKKQKIDIVTISDKNYPELLKQIYDPPFILYIKGTLKKQELCLAVVGTRKLTFYGKQMAPLISYDLAKSGFTIVSGMARGIDTLAHKSALKAKARTIAVLGSGIDGKSIYPPENRKLAEEIAENGAVISEYPPGTSALAYHFPQRNRIISGLSYGVLVIEAPSKSGALITAKTALDQNREVFAIPGSILWENSQGPNYLIKKGAKLVQDINDILEEFALKSDPVFKNIKYKIPNKEEIKPESREEELILKYIDNPIHIDKLARKTKLSINVLSSSLSLMEIKGKIKNLGGGYYVKTK